MPQVTTARTAAVSMMFCTLPIVRKSELRTEKTPNDHHQGDRWAGVPERHPPPRPGARRDDVQVLGGGCHGHEIGPCDRLKTLSHSKSDSSVSGAEKSATLSC